MKLTNRFKGTFSSFIGGASATMFIVSLKQGEIFMGLLFLIMSVVNVYVGNSFYNEGQRNEKNL